MKITVFIPTYRRPQDLARCLLALKQQTRTADQVIVVVRDSDTETWTMLKDFDTDPLPLDTVSVSVPGVVAAMNAGLDAALGDIIATTDDDAAPHPYWLERMEAHFLSDSRVGGVGGRDWQYVGDQLKELGEYEIVGRLQWFGRMIGNHHLGVGGPREVDVLKGVNMGYRRSAISNMRFDERLLGTGAQVHFELAFTLALKRKGWKIIYDPLVAVDHYPAQRFDEDQRDNFNDIAVSNMVHNETLALLEHFPPVQRAVFFLWAIFVGTRDAFGLLQFLRFLPKEGAIAGRKWLASMGGRWQGWQTWQRSLGELKPLAPSSQRDLGLG
ncbi:glycosyltransferase family 2 protein [Aetokthonos hydrillicola Thurmond2011]|jgi:glycosyltransferase involved in cell wall biosynthesis|uniref:Glycosyltransferase family 2 protein n=1 Tax=Aetokthonos hydrillicola Thurmond2011 TaxID=2712845 RepID=A0AAP5ICQ6_9CYAN|nr:glycosyltransferase family 2 protein [Aetokthonos hydrillicola]MBW4589641.1 glycosyltransferase family 2 protein [Aetokthonos hydrillicola CCALA 1050]MDR9899138.1 glycosyltransferase family 2 protein [Aetokthonos hydrillicola Thurmond2011]